MLRIAMTALACAAMLAACAQPASDDLETAEDELVTPAQWVVSETITLGNGDAADLYYPRPPRGWQRAFDDAFPVAVVLQGGQVDKAQYASFSRQVARNGFVVIVPNRLRALGPPGTPATPFTEANVIGEALTAVATRDADPTSALYRIVDTQRAGLLGHSFGGVVGLQAIGGLCMPPFCTPPFALPPEVKAAAFYGTNLVQPSGVIDVPTRGIAVALLRGDLDGRSTPASVEATYPVLDDARALITIRGANHFGITDSAAPQGAQPDPTPQTLTQAESTTAIATWAARWLRASLDTDPVAEVWIYGFGRSLDRRVIVDAAE